MANRSRTYWSAERSRRVMRDALARSSTPREPPGLDVEPFKFLSDGNCERIRIRQNYTIVEASEPTPNFVHFARSLINGKRFCVSVTKVLDEGNAGFSFVVGFTTCSPGAILNDMSTHLTEECSPTTCGGHSQQVKIFNANRIGSKVTFERQTNGEIYFAIDSCMPIHIKFDRNTFGVDLVMHERLTPFIQLSGNALSLATETQNIQELNVATAIGVRRGEPLQTVTAVAPPIYKRRTKSQILPSPASGQPHQAFVASSDDIDTKFIQLMYPENDVKVSVNRMAVLRKNEKGERFVFYLDKALNLNVQVTVQVTKIYNAVKYTSGFEFGLTTSRADQIEMNERESLIGTTSHCLNIDRDVSVNDKFTFTRPGHWTVEVRKNDVLQRVSNMDGKFLHTENLLPFVTLNGTVSGIIINNGTSDAVIEFVQMYELPAVDFKTTSNIALTNQTFLTWTQNGRDGVIVNAKPFDTILKFIIREVRTSASAHSMTFGLINSAGIGFKTPREIPTCLDLKQVNLIPAPALGLQFSLFKTHNGKVTLKCDNGQRDATTLFMVDPSQCFYPVLILNGSVVALELLPNPSKHTVKYKANLPTTSRPQQPIAPTNDCKICMDHQIDSVFVPCGHRFACIDCAKQWIKTDNGSYDRYAICPACRNEIQYVVQTFD